MLSKIRKLLKKNQDFHEIWVMYRTVNRVVTYPILAIVLTALLWFAYPQLSQVIEEAVEDHEVIEMPEDPLWPYESKGIRMLK